MVGKSHSGKTTLIEKLLPGLKEAGFMVATVKHVVQDLEMDKPGKDSWRLARSGADSVYVSTPDGLYMHHPVKRDMKLEELPGLIGPGYDLLLAEGFKESRFPKIEVHRKEIGGDLLFRSHQLVAAVSDEPLQEPVLTFPWDAMEDLVDFIIANFLSEPRGEARVELFVNEVPIQLNPFMVSILNRNLSALVSVLRGVGEINSMNLHTKNWKNIEEP
ncbi:molybdopterin-guanine dinucleotide biosynthesis protein B [Chloroflexota bacterium]